MIPVKCPICHVLMRQDAAHGGQLHWTCTICHGRFSVYPTPFVSILLNDEKPTVTSAPLPDGTKPAEKKRPDYE